MLLTVQHLQHAVQNIKEDIGKIDAEFKTNSPAAEYNQMHEELKTNI